MQKDRQTTTIGKDTYQIYFIKRQYDSCQEVENSIGEVVLTNIPLIWTLEDINFCLMNMKSMYNQGYQLGQLQTKAEFRQFLGIKEHCSCCNKK